MVVKVDEEVRQLILGGILGDVAVNLPALDLNSSVWKNSRLEARNRHHNLYCTLGVLVTKAKVL